MVEFNGGLVGQFLKLNIKEPTESAGGGAIFAQLEGALGRATRNATPIIRAVMQRIRDAAEEGWPIDRHTPHSKHRFRLIERTQGFYVQFTIVNDADYSGYVYYKGLGLGPHPGPGKGIRRWQDAIETELENERDTLRELLRSRILDTLRGGE